MKLAVGMLWILVAQGEPAKDGCEEVGKKAGEVKRAFDAWSAKHNEGCSLCPSGAACRDGFERIDAGRREIEGWKLKHMAECEACAAKVCGAADTMWNLWATEARTRHLDKCKRCTADKGCEGLKAALDEVKKRLEEWKRDHPAGCDKCAPACGDWRKRAAEIDARADEATAKHVGKCFDCKSAGACERTARLAQERSRDRLAAWKLHAACPCLKPK